MNNKFRRDYEILILSQKKCYYRTMLNADPILKRYQTELEAEFGDRLDSIVLFGSRARGEATPDSDYDVAVFIHRATSLYEEGKKLSKIETAIARNTGVLINSIPFSADAPNPPTILMNNIRREGITL
jgi:predicted nucleotidyltransferase